MLNLCVLVSTKWMDLLDDRTRHLGLFGSEKNHSICNRVRYFIGVESNITYVISHNYAKIKADSYDSSPLEKKKTFHNVVILIKSVFNKDKNNYYYYYCCYYYYYYYYYYYFYYYY